MPRLTFGLQLSANRPAAEYATLARLGEDLGFQRVTVQDNLAERGTWLLQTLAAAATTKVLIGPNVSNPYVRHPIIIAGNIATLDEISGGRAILGLGRGSFYHVINLPAPKAVTAVRETILLVRRFLAGDKDAFEGELFSAREGFGLNWQPPRKDIQIFIGAIGERMCRLAGELADAILPAGVWHPDSWAPIQAAVQAGAGAAGRDPATVLLGLSVWTSVAARREDALALGRAVLGRYLPHLGELPARFGVAPGQPLADETVGKFMAAGTIADIREQVARMAAAGVQHITFAGPHGPDVVRAIRLLGEVVRA